VAYRPLVGGLLSGKTIPQHAPRGFPQEHMSKVQPILDLAASIGEAHDGKTVGQVALNWLICKGALPIPGATKVEHVHQNAGAIGWRLTEEEVAALDAAYA
jgi:aryl-alcohol dehydrogenase-like predicted oxidoreductase